MEQLKSMKEMLTSQVHAQLANIEKADYHELGAAIDICLFHIKEFMKEIWIEDTVKCIMTVEVRAIKAEDLRAAVHTADLAIPNAMAAAAIMKILEIWEEMIVLVPSMIHLI